MITNYIISLGMILVGGWMLYRAFLPRIKSNQAAKWPTVEAEILETIVEEDRIRSATGKANLAFIPVVRYQYIVNGVRHEGDRVTFARAGYDFLDASNIRDQFAAGQKVPVHYNPSDPSESVLKPRATIGMISRVPGFFLAVLGLLLLIYLVIFGR